ncbi:transglycosylase SLT domain-containing protein [Brucella pseudogrignonensis]|uniref:lytic transglycosylase domain-containing protein n=1 Tax=Brucella pseudogrignonensis TaxID=419475 RepID=UPI0028B99A4A|nr:transglycosylase SLT domain-containing protein [Brucella pseudogrignonensis]MDT6939007.1 transglycosylase SLT domain-containing protein [Brucella pseudogrignonensis]
MKSKFVVVCALIGAMSSFGLNSAISAPVNEPTNLADLLKARAQNKAVEANKSEKASRSARSETKQTAKKASVITKRAAPAAKSAKRSKARSDAPKSAKVSGKAYSQIINRYASTYGVPSSLAHAVVRHESNFQPNVRGKAGEIGLMQIKLSTARGLGYTGSAKGLYEPSTNIQFGMKYLAMAQKLGGGSTCGTILKYNAGHGAKRMNPTSAKYCSSVKSYMAGL